MATVFLDGVVHHGDIPEARHAMARHCTEEGAPSPEQDTQHQSAHRPGRAASKTRSSRARPLGQAARAAAHAGEVRSARRPSGSLFLGARLDEPRRDPQRAHDPLLEPDIDQEVYGLPDYIGSLQSAWLNESATLFRRRYYLNGSHAGFIMYVNDEAHDKNDINAMRQALRDSKGPGNFRNLFLYAPKGKKDGVQIIPVSEVAAKDEFWNIKNITRDDQLAGHRIPPQLMGIIPSNTGGFGDVEKAARVFVANELEPLQQTMLEINDRIGEEVIRFRPYSLDREQPLAPLDPSR